MISIQQAVVVEGKYDKIKLSSFLDALILSTDGFRIFQDKEKCALLQTLAQTVGLIILTDSDRAGRQIRNHLKSVIKKGEVTHIYIPEILGKEPRKSKPSKEGMLGVEGVPETILRSAFEKAAIYSKNKQPKSPITKSDFVADGLSGAAGSAARRRKLLQTMQLPQNLSSNTLLEIINTLYTKEEYQALLKKINCKQKGEEV